MHDYRVSLACSIERWGRTFGQTPEYAVSQPGHPKLIWHSLAGRAFPVAQRERPESIATDAHEEALAGRWPWLLSLAAGIFLGAAGAVLILVVLVIAG
jgi:hypothetical protein